MGARFGSAAVEMAVALSRANALLARALGQALEPWAMTWPQALSLFVLEEQSQPISASHLVTRLGLGRTAMTSVVDRLERRGWVLRRPSARDRRVTHLTLTDSGRATAAAVRPAVRAVLAARLSALPPAAIAGCHTAILELAAALQPGAAE